MPCRPSGSRLHRDLEPKGLEGLVFGLFKQGTCRRVLSTSVTDTVITSVHDFTRT